MAEDRRFQLVGGTDQATRDTFVNEYALSPEDKRR